MNKRQEYQEGPIKMSLFVGDMMVCLEIAFPHPRQAYFKKALRSRLFQLRSSL